MLFNRTINQVGSDRLSGIGSVKGNVARKLGRGKSKGLAARRTNKAILDVYTLENRLVPTALVGTDLADYAPGETAYISASNFAIGSEVEFKVSHVLDAGADGIFGTLDDTIDEAKNSAGTVHTPWTVIDGSADDLDGEANGKITTSWYVNPDDSEGARFLLTAKGMGLSGNVEVASNTFTDASTNPAVSLTQWENLAGQWANGQANKNQATYLEGDVVPYKLDATGLTANLIYGVRINLNTYSSNTDAGGFLYLDTYNKSIKNIGSIPASQDSIVTTSNLVYPDPHMNFYVTNADVLSVNYIQSSDGKNQFADVQFKANAITAQLYWGERLALPNEVRTSANPGDVSLGASAFPGGSLQTKIEGSPAPVPGVTWITPSNAVQLQLGVVVQGSISGYKWNDLNGNGTKDTGEPALAGWVMNLYEDTDNDGAYDKYISSVTTADGTIDANGDGKVDSGDLGYYKFAPVVRGTYFVTENQKSDWVQTYPGSSANFVQGPLVIDSTHPTWGNVNFGNQQYKPSFSITKKVESITGGNNSGSSWIADSNGDIINYNITLANTGNITLTGVNITDRIESNTTPLNLTLIGGDSTNPGKLDPGEVWVYSAHYTVTQADLDSKGFDGDGNLTNTVTANTIEVSKPQNATAIVPLAYSPAYSIIKTASILDGSTAADQANDFINYKIEVKNTGDITVTGLNVTDQVEGKKLTEANYVSGDTNNDGNLDVTETWIYSANYTVTQGDLDGKGGGDGNLTNTATVTSSLTDLGPQNAIANVPLVYAPTLSIVKSATVWHDSVQYNDGMAHKAKDVINYNITVTNTGNITLTGIDLTDDFELGSLTLTPPDDAVNGDKKISPGESWTYTASYIVTQDNLDNANVNKSILNTAKVDTAETEPASSSVDVPLVYDPSVAIVKSATVWHDSVQYNDGMAHKAKDVINYNITVTNTGNITLTGIDLTDDFELGSLTLTPPDDAVNGDKKISPGESWTYTASYIVTQDNLDNANVNKSILNTAKVDTAETEPASSSVDVPLVYDPSVAIVKSATVWHDSVQYNDGMAHKAKDVINYNITVTNTGNITLTGIDLTDDFELGSLTLTPPDDAVNGDKKISPGESWTYTASYTVQQSDLDNANVNASILNTATVDTAETGEKVASVEVSLDYDPSVAIDKAATITHKSSIFTDDQIHQAGDVINYTVTVTNTGNITLTGIDLKDQFELGSLTLTPPDDAVNGDKKISPGESWTYTASYTVQQSDLDNANVNASILNTATVDTAETGEKVASVEVSLVYSPSFNLTKSASISGGVADQIGDIIDYTIKVFNDGNITLTGLNVTDRVESYGLDILTAYTGDEHDDGKLSPGETWIYTANYTLQADDFLKLGGGDGYIDNVANATCKEGVSHKATASVELKTAAIGDMVWWDSNGNGLQDDFDNPDGPLKGVEGAVVTLHGPSDLTLSMTTKSDGKYLFSNLPLGDYSVHFEKPSGYLLTANLPANATISDTLNSDADPLTGNSTSIQLTGGLNGTVDAGMFQPVTIGDFVWVDSNGDGIQTEGEPGLANVKILINGKSNAGVPVVGSNTSNSTGGYSFTGLAPGNYTISYETPAGYAPTTVGAVSATSIAIPASEQDSNANGTEVIFPLNGNKDLSVDFGFIPLNTNDGKAGTLGFYTNKNGQSALTVLSKGKSTSALLQIVKDMIHCQFDNELTTDTLSGKATKLALVGATGALAYDYFDGADGYTKLASYLSNANATNMAYMLSAQLLTAELNVLLGKISKCARIYVPAVTIPSTGAFMSSALQGSLANNNIGAAGWSQVTGVTPNQPGVANVQDIFKAAISSLKNKPNTVASGADRTYQEALKDLLDGMNNNQKIYL